MKKTEQSEAPVSWSESTLANDPPLRAVRAFEAIARLGSVTLAAQELAISPSAVSHQLKVLEGYLQIPLTERQGRRLTSASRGGSITARSARRLTCCARPPSIWSSRCKPSR
jgi:DNA-binding transcriptional ArsR family regulator